MGTSDTATTKMLVNRLCSKLASIPHYTSLREVIARKRLKGKFNQTSSFLSLLSWQILATKRERERERERESQTKPESTSMGRQELIEQPFERTRSLTTIKTDDLDYQRGTTGLRELSHTSLSKPQPPWTSHVHIVNRTCYTYHTDHHTKFRPSHFGCSPWKKFSCSHDYMYYHLASTAFSPGKKGPLPRLLPGTRTHYQPSALTVALHGTQASMSHPTTQTMSSINNARCQVRPMVNSNGYICTCRGGDRRLSKPMANQVSDKLRETMTCQGGRGGSPIAN